MAQSRYMKRVTSFEPVNIDPSELMTIMDAARYLGITKQTVSLAAQKGHLTQIIDTVAPNPQHERTLLLRSEVEAWRRRRETSEKE